MHNSALFSFILSASTFLSYSTLAACTASPDCATLGYDKTSCPSGDSVLKCPFDTTKLKCIPQTCETIGKRTCGENCVPTIFAGCCSDNDCEVGQKCNNTVCEDFCGQNPYSIGDIYCNAGGTPIGVVGHITNGGKNGIVVALEDAPSKLEFGCNGTDLSLTNFPAQDVAADDFNGKTNTDIIANKCGNNTAAYFCKNTYNKEGISGWYLPALGELSSMLYVNYAAINMGLGKISSDSYINGGYCYWSSTERDNNNAWERYASRNISYSGKQNRNRIRCVLAF